MDLGKMAYEAYVAYRLREGIEDGMPAWDDLDQQIIDQWGSVAAAVQANVGG